MPTFVLVHGGWVGGWFWRKLRPLLTAKGHEVFTPTFTGMGERAHLLTPDISLETHIEDVASPFKYEDLRNVVLVAHSYGGMVAAGVADRLPERIAHVVFLDAFVPSDGQSVFDLGYPHVEATGDMNTIPIPERLLRPAPEEDWLRGLPTPSPAGAGDRIRLNKAIEEDPFRLTYVKATGDAPLPERGGNPGFWRIADRVRNDPRWSYHEIETTHGFIGLRPDPRLLDILLAA